MSCLFAKNHLYPLMISTIFVQFQTSTSFSKFLKKFLPPAFSLTCLLTLCLLLFIPLTGYRSYRIFPSTETTLLKIHSYLILAMDHGEVRGTFKDCEALGATLFWGPQTIYSFVEVHKTSSQGGEVQRATMRCSVISLISLIT